MTTQERSNNWRLALTSSITTQRFINACHVRQDKERPHSSKQNASLAMNCGLEQLRLHLSITCQWHSVLTLKMTTITIIQVLRDHFPKKNNLPKKKSPRDWWSSASGGSYSPYFSSSWSSQSSLSSSSWEPTVFNSKTKATAAERRATR